MAGMIVSIVLSAILILVGLILSFNNIELVDVLFVFFGTMIVTAISVELSNQDKPTAMDVYRNKTTLKVTYVDSVATDSVVVFK